MSKIAPDLAEFLKANINLLQKNKLGSLYLRWEEYRNTELTEFLYSAGINPLSYMSKVPEWYLTGHIGNIKTVYIPSNCTSIGENAFAGMDNLKNVYMHDGIVTIENDAFDNTPSLEAIHIPEKLQIIPSSFCKNSGIKKIMFGGNSDLTTLSSTAFSNCNNLTEVHIPEGVEFIGYHCFYGCSRLTRVILPYTIESLDDFAFANCVHLSEVEFQGSKQEFENIYEGDGVFRNCPNSLKIKCTDGYITDYSR